MPHASRVRPSRPGARSGEGRLLHLPRPVRRQPPRDLRGTARPRRPRHVAHLALHRAHARHVPGRRRDCPLQHPRGGRRPRVRRHRRRQRLHVDARGPSAPAPPTCRRGTAPRSSGSTTTPPVRPRAGSTTPDKDVARWDMLLSPNPVSTERLRHAFGFGGAVHETGYPRNDVLSSPHRDDVRARVRAELGIADGTTAVLYAPTWRDDLVFDAHGGTGLRGADRPGRLRRPAGRRPRAADRGCTAWSPAGWPSRPAPRSSTSPTGAESAELYLAADMLVTDYSSAMFDFAVTGKPMVFYTYDLEHYRDDLRGFYFDLAEIAPGPLVRTSEELVEAIADDDVAASELADRVRPFPGHLLLARRRARHRPRARPALPARRPRRSDPPWKGDERADHRPSPDELSARSGPHRGATADLHPPVQAVILAAGMGTRLGRSTPSRSRPCATAAPSSGVSSTRCATAFGDDTDITVVVGFSSDLLMAAVAGRALRLQPALRDHQHVEEPAGAGCEQPRRRRPLDQRRRRLRPRRARARAELRAGRRELRLRRHRHRRRRGDQVHPRRATATSGSCPRPSSAGSARPSGSTTSRAATRRP